MSTALLIVHYLTPAFAQRDEEDDRRKRRREKNKVAAARCRNKKKERTEYLQQVGYYQKTEMIVCYLCV